jgi:hypothetical protein
MRCRPCRPQAGGPWGPRARCGTSRAWLGETSCCPNHRPRGTRPGVQLQLLQRAGPNHRHGFRPDAGANLGPGEKTSKRVYNLANGTPQDPVYGALDTQNGVIKPGRATSATACLTPPVKTGERASRIKFPGWDPRKMDRTHLLARQFGGAGGKQNIVGGQAPRPSWSLIAQAVGGRVLVRYRARRCYQHG